MHNRSSITIRLALSVASTICFIAIEPAASTAQNAAAAQSVPVIPAVSVPSADPNRIAIDVEVADKLGHPITGLQAQDFTLLDNRQPSKILDFHEIDARNPATDPVHVVIVLDTINADFDVFAQERELLVQYLKSGGGRLAHPTSLAILTEKGIQVEKTPTRDGNGLAATLTGANSELRMIGRSAGFWGAVDRMNWSLEQLNQLAAYEESQPGRKFAFVLSPGWPLLPFADFDATDKQLQWIFNSIAGFSNNLREAHLTLYALDPFELGRTDPFYYETFLKGVSRANDAQYGNLGLQVLATHSGGQVLSSARDVAGELDTVSRDTDDYYTLTFEAPPADHRNEYHEVQLKVDKPGAKVRTTTGYYANAQQ